MAEPPGDDVLVVPPMPLATGQLLEPEGDGPPVRITKRRVRRLHRGRRRAPHPPGPPARRLVGALIASPRGSSDAVTARIHPHPEG